MQNYPLPTFASPKRRTGSFAKWINTSPIPVDKTKTAAKAPPTLPSISLPTVPSLVLPTLLTADIVSKFPSYQSTASIISDDSLDTNPPSAPPVFAWNLTPASSSSSLPPTPSSLTADEMNLYNAPSQPQSQIETDHSPITLEDIEFLTSLLNSIDSFQPAPSISSSTDLHAPITPAATTHDNDLGFSVDAPTSQAATGSDWALPNDATSALNWNEWGLGSIGLSRPAMGAPNTNPTCNHSTGTPASAEMMGISGSAGALEYDAEFWTQFNLLAGLTAASSSTLSPSPSSWSLSPPAPAPTNLANNNNNYLPVTVPPHFSSLLPSPQNTTPSLPMQPPSESDTAYPDFSWAFESSFMPVDGSSSGLSVISDEASNSNFYFDDPIQNLIQPPVLAMSDNVYSPAPQLHSAPSTAPTPAPSQAPTPTQSIDGSYTSGPSSAASSPDAEAWLSSPNDPTATAPPPDRSCSASIKSYLRTWFLGHAAYPYPSSAQKLELCEITGLSLAALEKECNSVRRWMRRSEKRRLERAGVGLRGRLASGERMSEGRAVKEMWGAMEEGESGVGDVADVHMMDTI